MGENRNVCYTIEDTSHLSPFGISPVADTKPHLHFVDAALTARQKHPIGAWKLISSVNDKQDGHTRTHPSTE